MQRKEPRVIRHFLELRIVSIYGALYFITLLICTIIFYKMMTSKFSHLIFWSWCAWTFVTAYFFFLFMRSVLGPVIQIYQNQVILNYPKRRHILRTDVKGIQQQENAVIVNFMENGAEISVKVPIRPPVVDPYSSGHI
jgi:hypothetical protein